MKSSVKQIKKGPALIMAGIAVFLVASTLRAPPTAVGPVIEQIKAEFQLSATSAGLLTSIPLFTWAVLSVLVGRYSLRFKMEKVILFSMILLALGLLARVWGNISMLFIGSAIIGIGICVGNVLMPAFVKKVFSAYLGLMTGVYTVAMNIAAAIASGFSIAIGRITGMEWKGALGIWLILTIIAAGIWALQLKNKPRDKKASANARSRHNQSSGPQDIFRSRLAWSISIYMGLQSLLYYSLVAWLPKILMDYGMDNTTSGWVLSYFLLATLPVTFVGPIIAHKMRDQKKLIWIVVALMVVGVALLIAFQEKYAILAAICLGMSNGFAFSLSMLFFSLRTESATTAIQISGMAQSIGYLIAAFGPAIFGWIYDISKNWNYAFYFLLATAGLILILGLIASSNRTIEEELNAGKHAAS